jgi:hypothetical protein
MRAVNFAFAAISATFFLVDTAESEMRFACDVGICACKGASDCQDMRRSGMCDGPVNCKTTNGILRCGCTAAKSASGIAKQPPAATGTMQKQ